MENQFNNQRFGEQLGVESAVRVESLAERCCACEKQRIEITNRPLIAALRAELALLREREQNLAFRVSHALPPGDLRSRRRNAWYYWAVALTLTIAGFFFSLVSFEPFRLGSKAVLYCVGLAILTPFAMERFLAPEKERLVKAFAMLAFIAALASGVLLAVVRGNLLARAIQEVGSAVVIEGDAPAAAPAETNPFYQHTLILVCIVMGLVALGMELSAGLALREARRLGAETGDDPEALAAERSKVQQRMIACLAELTALEGEAESFEARFWRDFFHSMLTRAARSAITKLLVAALASLVIVPHRAVARDRVNLVVLVDLTKSVDVKGPDGKTESEKNFEAVARLLSRVPAGAHVTVLGITDNSFAQPYILLSAEVGNDEGYFKERLASARRQLAEVWKVRVKHVRQGFLHTDMLGALLLASQYFEHMPDGENRVLIIFSDMRQNTALLDLETPKALSGTTALTKVTGDRLIVPLKNVEVQVLGVDNSAKQPVYWEGLREFWVTYFKKAGADVTGYSVLRDLPQF
jgi:hypothetical protein